MTKQPFTVVQFDDDALWCSVTADVISKIGNITYRRCVGGTEHALEMVRSISECLVLIDVRYSEGEGVRLVSALHASQLSPRVVIVTMTATEAVLYHLSTRQIAGMIWKHRTKPACLRDAILDVLAGRIHVPSDICDAVRSFRSRPDAFFKILSNREIELLPAFGRGDTDEEIAAVFHLSAKTIKSHRHRILKKLGLRGTKKLMRWAHEKGFAAFDTPRSSVDEFIERGVDDGAPHDEKASDFPPCSTGATLAYPSVGGGLVVFPERDKSGRAAKPIASVEWPDRGRAVTT